MEEIKRLSDPKKIRRIAAEQIEAYASSINILE